MFSEGGCGNGDIHNMIEIFNIVSSTLLKNKIDENLIWYEYGQIMRKCYEWTKYIDDHKYEFVDLSRKPGMNAKEYRDFKRMWRKQLKGIGRFYQVFNKYMDQAKKRLLSAPVKHYTYVE